MLQADILVWVTPGLDQPLTHGTQALLVTPGLPPLGHLAELGAGQAGQMAGHQSLM